jgi:hypothetical protein
LIFFIPFFESLTMSEPQTESNHAAVTAHTATVVIMTNDARFTLGQTVATPGALQLLQETGHSVVALLARHLHADWGDICQEDAALNDQALLNGSRLLSAYRLVDAVQLKATPESKRIDLPTAWVITEAAADLAQPRIRQITTLLLPSEY